MLGLYVLSLINPNRFSRGLSFGIGCLLLQDEDLPNLSYNSFDVDGPQ